MVQGAQVQAGSRKVSRARSFETSVQRLLISFSDGTIVYVTSLIYSAKS